MGEDIVLHSGKPERAGHTAYTGKQIRPVDGVQSKQAGQRIPSDPPPGRYAGKLFLCRGDDLSGQEPQIVVRAAGARLGVFEGRRTVPGHHIVVPVEITDGHQCERWTTSSLCGLVYLLSLVREDIEVADRNSFLQQGAFCGKMKYNGK